MTTLTLASEVLIAGRYRLAGEIARGGIAVIFEAVDVVSERRVAVKMLREGANALGAARLVEEARIASRIESEHVVRILDLGVDDPFVVLELLRGQDLSAYCQEHGPLRLEEVATYAIQACHALARAHALGVVHRDVKPSNLFRHETPDGKVTIKLIDFGIAKSSTSDATLTTDRQFLGSPPYMSPEQIKDPRSADGRSDLWSLGVVIYRLLTGEHAFEGSRVDEVVARILGARSLPSLAQRGFPKALDAVLARCVAPAPKDRFPDATALARALAPFTGDTSSIALVPSRPKEKRAWGIALMLGTAITIFTTAAQHQRAEPTNTRANAPAFPPPPTEPMPIIEIDDTPFAPPPAPPSASTARATKKPPSALPPLPPVIRRPAPPRELQPNPYAGGAT